MGQPFRRSRLGELRIYIVYDVVDNLETMWQSSTFIQCVSFKNAQHGVFFSLRVLAPNFAISYRSKFC